MYIIIKIWILVRKLKNLIFDKLVEQHKHIIDNNYSSLICYGFNEYHEFVDLYDYNNQKILLKYFETNATKNVKK